MSTKAKIGKDWVKCQVSLSDTGETLHLTFAPGETRKKVFVHIDGRTDSGHIELVAVPGAKEPHDATLKLVLRDEGVSAKPVVKADVKPAAPKPAAPAPVVAAVDVLPPPPEEIVVSEVQEPAADQTPAAGGKRGKKSSTVFSE